MNYFIQRDDQQYGPYTLSDLQRYTASGEISLSDLATSDASAEPVPVAQIIGTIAVPQGFVAAPAVSFVPDVPSPPNLHWGLVLLFSVLTCGIFVPVWELVLAVWVKKYEPESKTLLFYCGAIALLIAHFVLSATARGDGVQAAIGGLLNLVYAVVAIVARFNLKHWLEQHYNSTEQMGLQLSGVMTFFFGGIYFQYHVNDIVRRKQADLLYQNTR